MAAPVSSGYTAILTAINTRAADYEGTWAAGYYELFEHERAITTALILAAGSARSGAATAITGATTLTSADNGKTYFLNSATGFNVTLPAAAAGLRFTFIVTTAPTSGNHTVTAATADTIAGKVFASSGGDENSNTAGDLVNFVANTSLVGDRLELWCNGSIWIADGFCDVTGSITVTG